MHNTEKRNKNTMHIDKKPTVEMLKLIQQENYNAVKAIEEVLA